uniref:Uncharacterized protein n=1 Tax=Physcomitrium patens TaxID=3218 RepID=A0A7I4D1C6_PHYPA
MQLQETTICRKCEGCGAEDSKARAQILQLPHVLVLELKQLHMDRDFPCTKVTSHVKLNSRLNIVDDEYAKTEMKFKRILHNTCEVVTLTADGCLSQ